MPAGCCPAPSCRVFARLAHLADFLHELISGQAAFLHNLRIPHAFGGSIYRFGPFGSNAPRGRPSVARNACRCQKRSAKILLRLLTHVGEVVAKDALADATWRGAAGTDNSLDQAISRLRKTLGRGGTARTTSKPSAQPWLSVRGGHRTDTAARCGRAGRRAARTVSRICPGRARPQHPRSRRHPARPSHVRGCAAQRRPTTRRPISVWRMPGRMPFDQTRAGHRARRRGVAARDRLGIKGVRSRTGVGRCVEHACVQSSACIRGSAKGPAGPSFCHGGARR